MVSTLRELSYTLDGIPFKFSETENGLNPACFLALVLS